MENWASTAAPLAILVVAFWLLVLRPARRRQREFRGLQSTLAPGQQVMLASGIFGETVSIDDELVQLRIAPDTVITVNRHAISRIVTDEPEPGAATSTESSADD